MYLRHHSSNILNFSLKDQLVHFIHTKKIIGQVGSEFKLGNSQALPFDI